LYERTGSLLPGIALHSFVDSSGIDIELAGNDLIVIVVFGLLAATLLVRASVARPRPLAPVAVPGAP
jgi:membrane protease YdiL (CAAX protease family)